MRKMYTIKKISKETLDREGDTIHVWLTAGEVVCQTTSEKKALEYVSGLTLVRQGHYQNETERYIIL